ncbi:secreted RxLR effector protein 161-like [Lycium ferocissimum]|uniref:secreted RxLR effector protein 161-like n=1 Tax=Lycium ferocissimum TaxID=112874 RepID=UPI0028166E8A|nr:secreted RxLR effector protein 161-like [Lycium ferocissimum]
MEITQGKDRVLHLPEKYAKEILKKFDMENCKDMNTPMNQKEQLCKDDGAEKVEETYFRSLIGCLMYLTTIRPDILYDVSVLPRFMHCPSEVHLKAAKRIVRYIKGTITYGVKFQKSQPVKLFGYSDSDWGGSVDDLKSTSGYCFSLGLGIFLQDIVAQSTAEAEFLAATSVVNQALWLKKILVDLHMEPTGSIELSGDNGLIGQKFTLCEHSNVHNIL